MELYKISAGEFHTTIFESDNQTLKFNCSSTARAVFIRSRNSCSCRLPINVNILDQPKETYGKAPNINSTLTIQSLMSRIRLKDAYFVQSCELKMSYLAFCQSLTSKFESVQKIGLNKVSRVIFHMTDKVIASQ